MSTHKHIDKICCVIVALSLLITVLLMNGDTLGIQRITRTMGYEDRLFDPQKVHTIDIAMDDWDSFLSTCENEEYSLCTVLIDGETYRNVGIRAKGNTSLSSVSQMNSDRYSFKIEFDQYDATQSYYGLDKISLNNLIQDNTFMKDYLVYQMMNQFGVAAPLCSYTYITVNGEDWGLYLAVEAVEDSFLQRNYGSDYGELYKPDSMSFGGGRGNGKDFHMEQFDLEGVDPGTAESFDFENFDPGAMQLPEGFDPSAMPGRQGGDFGLDTDESGRFGGAVGNMGGGMPGGMGSDDVKLQYIDDDPDSYSNIFDSAKTEITAADQARLIESLKTLSQGEDIAHAVDVEAVIRYFVVHNFVVNGDSYTGSMIHNYYLYEDDGPLSMIPWDYNLAFGTFQGSSASDAVNDDIDAPLSVTGSGDRPMMDWILSDEEYTALYHEYFREFLQSVFDSGYFTETVDAVRAMIAPYVEKDPSKFCTYEEFETGAAALRQFCLLRAESVAAQLAGEAANIDVGELNLSDMGTMGNTMGGGDPNFDHGFGGDRDTQTVTPPDGAQRPDSGSAEGGTGTEIPSGTERPGGTQFPQETPQAPPQTMPGGSTPNGMGPPPFAPFG